MLNFIDKFLNKITMYKLVLYYLEAIIIVAFILSFFGLVPYNPLAILFSSLFILIICWLVNSIFAWAFKVPANVESVYITALILACLISPIANVHDSKFFIFAVLASVLAMASKYILVIKKKHVFNPAAIALVITSLVFGLSARWWVGTISLVPIVLIGGILLTRKLIRADLVWSFIITALVVTAIPYLGNRADLINILSTVLFHTAFLFFAFVMLTEPLTTPPTCSRRIVYGIFVGLLFSPYVHIGSVYFTPEIALIAGNIFSYILSPKQKLVLKLKKKIQSAKDIVDFIFIPDQKLKFSAGQYMEWTIDPKGADSRGNRRYLTIASSPTEDVIALGVRFPEIAPSTFKQKLLSLKEGDTILAGQLSGDFTLPKYNSKGENKKIVLVAGGIGITPYYSMIRNTIDTGEKRDIVLLYSNKVASDAIYQFLWDEAREKIGLKTIYAVTDKTDLKYTGRFTEELIKKEVPDYLERYFYLSGPHQLVVGFEETLKNLGIHRSHIKVDFFPGFV
jgi:ferredoxin-NADP reductase/Na+-translocating ferredoxin:NAD+ oxidoreductase RnfD subunit